MRTLRIAIALIAVTFASNAIAEGLSTAPKTITEEQLLLMSAAAYAELLRQAESKGHTYSEESIANGKRRHLEELMLRLMSDGYIILVGESGA